ncbi:Arm DNA-binding domain-containing protein [Castellaniella hirudinis]|uniref:Arm DNA-binding domain-containing protein n=1 Tax=Castellaniella hirudinis TaxID=1144617 RepID=UPI0039C1C856
MQRPENTEEQRLEEYEAFNFDGLSRYVSAIGSKAWHFRYSWVGRRGRFILGVYPALSLKDARAFWPGHLDGTPHTPPEPGRPGAAHRHLAEYRAAHTVRPRRHAPAGPYAAIFPANSTSRRVWKRTEASTASLTSPMVALAP